MVLLALVLIVPQPSCFHANLTFSCSIFDLRRAGDAAFAPIIVFSAPHPHRPQPAPVDHEVAAEDFDGTSWHGSRISRAAGVLAALHALRNQA